MDRFLCRICVLLQHVLALVKIPLPLLPQFTGSSIELPPANYAMSSLDCLLDTPLTAGLPALLINDAAEPDYKRLKLAHATVTALGSALSDSVREYAVEAGATENACLNTAVSRNYQAYLFAKMSHHLAAYALLSNAHRSHRAWGNTQLTPLSMGEDEANAHISAVCLDPRYAGLMPRPDPRI